MEIEIEKYRGYEIRFNTERETFVCDIDDERSVKKSFSAIKKFIDDFIKDNDVLKSFKIISKPNSGLGKKGIINVIGIRKDGRFIIDVDGKKQQLSDYDTSYYMLYDESNDVLIEQLQKVDNEYQLKLSELQEKEKEIISKMNIVCLKEYKEQL